MWTLIDRKKTKIQAMDMKFFISIEGKTIGDRIRK
jgi:hypothetical protein